VLTEDKRNVIVPVFVTWRMADPRKFLEAIGSVENACSKLDSLVSSVKNTVLGSYDFNQLVSINSDEVRLTEIENKIAQNTPIDPLMRQRHCCPRLRYLQLAALMPSVTR